jgi:hypothetical protein
MQTTHFIETMQPITCIFQINPSTYIMFSEQPSHLPLNISKKTLPHH